MSLTKCFFFSPRLLDICSDKTGTITQGRMIVRAAWLPGCGTYDVQATNDVYNPMAGSVRFIAAQPKDIDSADEKYQDADPASEPTTRPALESYLNIASLANLAKIEQSSSSDDEKPGQWKAEGAPTEVSIEVFVRRFGWDRAELTQGPGAKWRHLAEFSFDSDVKKMTVLFRNAKTGETHVFTKVYTYVFFRGRLALP